MGDIVERLRSIDHMNVEECFLDSYLYARAADEIERLRGALAGLIDDEPCWYDHHGYCQAHFVTSPCEMATARAALKGDE